MTSPEPAAPAATVEPGGPHPTVDIHTPAAIAVIVLAVLAVCTALWVAQEVFIPIAFALLVSYALDPLQRPLVKVGVPPTLAALLVVCLAVAAIGATAYGLRSQAGTFINSLPDAAVRIRGVIQQKRGGQPSAVSQVRKAAQELEKASSDNTPPTPQGVTRVQVETPALSASDLMWRGTGSAMTFAGQSAIVIVLVFYFLAAGDLYKRKLVRIFGTTISEKRLTVEILNEIQVQFGRYLVVRVLISLIVGVATWIAFWLLKMPSPAVWGVAAGVLNVIPYLGPTVVASSAAMAAFVHFGHVSDAVVLGLTCTAIACGEGFGLTPMLMGRAARMNGVAVFIALTVWGFLWGIWGLLLAVPLTMAIKVLCDHVEELHGLGELLGE